LIPLILIYGILFAGLDEYWQSFIPGRLSSQFDMLADISGIIFGSILTVWISREND
jgi:VanZ family protein